MQPSRIGIDKIQVSLPIRRYSLHRTFVVEIQLEKLIIDAFLDGQLLLLDGILLFLRLLVEGFRVESQRLADGHHL